jgi:hypothetical protein
VAVRGGRAGTGRRIAVEADAQRLPLLVGHHGEVELDAGHAIERADGRGHAVLDLLAQRAARHGEGDEDADVPSSRRSTSRTMPSSTIERRSSGSSTGRSASMICSVVGMELLARVSASRRWWPLAVWWPRAGGNYHYGHR